MIDFGSSVFNPTQSTTREISMDSEFVGGCEQNFIIPGCDMFVFLSHVRKLIMDTQNSTSPLYIVDYSTQQQYTRILECLNHIFREFFQFPDILVQQITHSDTDIHRQYDVLMTKGAGITPLGLLDRMLRSRIAMKKILQRDLPWEIRPRKNYIPIICKKKIPAFLADIMPNWKSIVTDDTFIQSTNLYDLDEIPQILDTLIDLVKNERIFFEFDYRPMMDSRGQVSKDILKFYQERVLNKDAYYQAYFHNTLLFYNMMTRFLETFYYRYHKKDQEFLNLFAEQTHKITTLLNHIQKPAYMSTIAGIIRFIQTIFNLQKAVDKRFCCMATNESLGQLGNDMMIQTVQQGRTQTPNPSIFKAIPQQSRCQQQGKIARDEYTLPQQSQSIPQIITFPTSNIRQTSSLNNNQQSTPMWTPQMPSVPQVRPFQTPQPRQQKKPFQTQLPLQIIPRQQTQSPTLHTQSLPVQIQPPRQQKSPPQTAPRQQKLQTQPPPQTAPRQQKLQTQPPPQTAPRQQKLQTQPPPQTAPRQQKLQTQQQKRPVQNPFFLF
jgi:hypothetical protein